MKDEVDHIIDFHPFNRCFDGKVRFSGLFNLALQYLLSTLYSRAIQEDLCLAKICFGDGRKENNKWY